MTTSITEEEKKCVSAVEQQRRIALYNIPPVRLGLVSPYPQFTNFQLNMRRKTEILKYNNNQQNTKTNNSTKKQSYSYLVNNRRTQQPPPVEQCPNDQFIPTLTTSCDIPGSPMLLQYDPTVQLYNYGNYKENRPYAIIPQLNGATFNFYTKNIIEYVELSLQSAIPDISLSYQSYIAPIGSLIVGKNLKTVTYSFSLSVPLGFWFSGSLGSGYDSDGNSITKPAISPTDILTFHITDISLNVLFNGNYVQPLQKPYLIYSPLIDCSFHLNTLYEKKQFYAIQYIGMLQITGLVLQTPPDSIYDLTVGFNYTYNNQTAYKLDYLQTGVFINMPQAYTNDYVFRCSLDSVSPNNFSKGDFTQYVVDG